MKLYSVTIRGFKYYFSGDLTSEAVTSIENFCLKLKTNSTSTDKTTLFEHLINYIASELGLTVTPINVEHIFRINY